MSTPLPVALLAGGLATRLGPLTESVPKSLLDVNGEPFLAHQLRLLRQGGIARVVLCVGHRGEPIRDWLGDGARAGLAAEYAWDGPRLLGTAGAVKRALPLLGPAFFVLYGDSYLDCDYAAVQEAFERSGKPGLMTIYRNEGRWDASNVEFADGALRAYDKKNRTPAMRHIDYGLGAFQAAAFAAVPDDRPSDLAGLYAELLRRGALAAFEARERFYEIGSRAGLEETRRMLAARASGRRGA